MASEKVQLFNDLNFDDEVLRSDLPVLVDFTATWCGPCKQLSPIVDQLATELDGKVKVGKLDIDDSPVTAGKYGVIQSFTCANAGGEKSEPEDKKPPCHVQGHSAWDSNLFPRLLRGKAPNQKAPDDPGVKEAGQPKHYP